MLLEKAAFQARLLLRIIRRCPKPGFEVPPEDEENSHEGKQHARQPEIKYEHSPDHKDCVENSLEGNGHKTRSQFRHLINVLFHAVEFLANRGRFVVVRRESVHLPQDSESNVESKILHCARINQSSKARETQPSNIN